MSDAEQNACYCYMVECEDGTFYTGWTTDVERRVSEHNAGRGARYTKYRRPVELVYVEELPDRSAAMSREHQLKKLSHHKKALLTQEFTPQRGAE